MPLVTVSATDNLSCQDVVIGGRPGSLQVAPKFPLALAATADLLNWSNAFPSQPVPSLASDITATSLIISVTPGQGGQFPLDTFEVSIDDEIIFISVRSGDALTVGLRGAESSTPTSHTTGASVQLLVTANSHDQEVAEIIEIEHLLGANGKHVFPTEVSLAPSSPGNFTVAHGLGVIPRYALIQMTSGGSIWFQAPRYDATNLYLVASDGGLTGFAEVWP